MFRHFMHYTYSAKDITYHIFLFVNSTLVVMTLVILSFTIATYFIDVFIDRKFGLNEDKFD